jgi:hypothetical protein
MRKYKAWHGFIKQDKKNGKMCPMKNLEIFENIGKFRGTA